MTLGTSVNATALVGAAAHGVGYAGAGFLVFYHLGVQYILLHLGIILPGVTPLAVQSSAALVSFAELGLIEPQQLLLRGLEFTAHCRAHGGCMQTLDAAVDKLLADTIAPGAAAVANGRLAMTVTWRGANGSLLPDMLTNYTSDDDLHESMRAAMFLPHWSAPHAMTTTLHGRPVSDGGVFDFAGVPCAPPARGSHAAQRAAPGAPASPACLQVSPLPAHMLREWLYQVQSALLADPMGAAAGAVSLISTSLPDILTDIQGLNAPDRRALLNMVVGWTAGGRLEVPALDIQPGRWNALPWGYLDHVGLMYNPCSLNQCLALYELGMRDAVGWATEQGLWRQGVPVPAMPLSAADHARLRAQEVAAQAAAAAAANVSTAGAAAASACADPKQQQQHAGKGPPLSWGLLAHLLTRQDRQQSVLQA